MIKKIKFLAVLLLLGLSLSACNSTHKSISNNKPTNKEVINQISLLQGLMLGDYYGSITVKELKSMGDTGIGTFDKLNGELIMTNGIVYRAKADGSVEVVGDDELIPFSNVTKFEIDEKYIVSNINNIDDVLNNLNNKIENINVNQYYMVKIVGDFTKMNVRSEKAQQEPYKPLVEVLKTDQTFFNYENVEGTVVALYMPPYMGNVNTTGWHLHFISKDGTKGGHILDLSIKNAEIQLDYTQGFELYIPDGEFFKSLDLTIEQDDDIKEVEQGK